MINLRLRTEYSFGICYGPLPKVIDAVGAAPVLGICDRAGTWGHVAFERACKKAGKRAIFGVELAVVPSLAQEKLSPNYMGFIARNNEGLREIYELVTEASSVSNFYFHPRIETKRIGGITENVAILSGTNPYIDVPPISRNLLLELQPGINARRIADYAKRYKLPIIAASDNFYPRPEHKSIYEIVAARRRDSRTTPMHILDEWEWDAYMESYLSGNDRVGAIQQSITLANECNATIPRARLVKFNSPVSLEAMCLAAAKDRKVDLKDARYAARLRRELDLIADKQFEDYFFVIADMLKFAKQHMLVGPARGSSCGSLVCYLLSITEIDPLKFGLLFERFIDVNRKDLPDIDIDFPDNRRDMVFEYVAKKYGQDCVARLGTVLRYQSKSAIDAVAIALRIPKWETENLKNSILTRSTGDARAASTILDTLTDLDIGREMLRKYPHIAIASELEDHASTTGQHAAGIVITAEPIARFCSVNSRVGVAQVDKIDAELVNLLKIDALGLRTLSVIQDALDQIGKTRDWIMNYPLNDQKAFNILNRSQFAGIFQFEGYALQSLCQQMKVDRFDDIAALGALARPGPLNSGGASEYIKRRTGAAYATPLHSSIETLTADTYGVVIYQEQVMEIARHMGRLSWEDVSSLRKAMSKSLGDEFFDKYKNSFMEGARAQNIADSDSLATWKSICTMGSWSFNKSHAVAYGTISYWCLVIKANYPLEWACACLRHASHDDQVIKLLRELNGEGFEYKDYDLQLSGTTWSISSGKLIGGLTNIIGIGEKKAAEILSKRKSGKDLTPGLKKKLLEGDTPFSHNKVFACRTRFAEVMKDPSAYGIVTRITSLSEITADSDGDFLFWGKIVKKDLRDLNEPFFVQKRDGALIPDGQPRLFLNLTVEDDTANVLISVGKKQYADIGVWVYQNAKLGDWLLWKGSMRRGYRKISINRYLTEEQILRRKLP